jgi:hypothetical protein
MALDPLASVVGAMATPRSFVDGNGRCYAKGALPSIGTLPGAAFPSKSSAVKGPAANGSSGQRAPQTSSRLCQTQGRICPTGTLNRGQRGRSAILTA